MTALSHWNFFYRIVHGVRSRSYPFSLYFFLGAEQAQAERLKEQEQEREERARLDEILQMCAEYQRQMDQEQRHSAPPSHHLASLTVSQPRANGGVTGMSNGGGSANEAGDVTHTPDSTLDESFTSSNALKLNFQSPASINKPPPSPAGHSLHPNRYVDFNPITTWRDTQWLQDFLSFLVLSFHSASEARKRRNFGVTSRVRGCYIL